MKNLYVVFLSWLTFGLASTTWAQVETFNYKKALTINRTLSASILTINRTTGEVVFGGADGRGPSTPGLTFTWIWGDGTSNNGFFPQTKKYADVTKNYTAKVISNYSGSEKDTVEVLVDFIRAKLNPVALDPKLKVFIPRQPVVGLSNSATLFPDRIIDESDRAQLEYLLHVGSTVQYDFVNENVVLFNGKFEQYMFRDSLFPGAYALWNNKPVAFGAGDVLTGGEVDYSSLYHEMGHNYTLNSPVNYFFGGKTDGRAFAFYGEAMAQIFQYATGYEVINHYQKYGLDAIMLSKYKANFFNGVARLRGSYQEYVKDGMRFATWARVPGGYSYNDSKDAFLTFLSIPYKFCEYAEQQGIGYRQPAKRMMQFLQRFNPEWQRRYDPANDTPAGNSFRATMMVAALSHAFQKDLRADFRAINYPVSDSDWAFLSPQLLSVSTNALAFAASPAGPASVTVTATDGWSASSSQPWLTADATTGSGNRVVSLSAAANPSLTPRTAIFTVSANGLADQVITVTQTGTAPTLTASVQSLSFAAVPVGTSVSITANTSWSVVSSQSWLTTSLNAGSGNQVVSVSATANALAAPRTATLTILANGTSSQVVPVVQAGAPATVSTSVASLSVDAGGGTPSVSVSSNTTWTATSSQPWLLASPASGSGTMALTLTAAANTGIESRSATVTVAATGLPDQTISVVQRGVVVTSLPNPQGASLRIYPNPVLDQLYLEGAPVRSTIQIYDVSGRLLQQRKSTGSAQWLSTEALPAGVYYLRVQSDASTTGRRFIKMP